MQYKSGWDSPLGPLVMTGSEAGLTGLWFEGQKYFPQELDCPEGELPVFQETRAWLQIYFQGRDPGPTPVLCPEGTAFRRAVWDLLREIPYGRTVTYGSLAERLGGPGKRMSAQAIGGAVGHNPISILIPCHRVVGTDGSLTGYAGGLGRKRSLLRLEGVDLSGFYAG